MKALFLMFVFATSMPGRVSATEASTGTWTGWIVDSRCGAKNANPQGKECALSCAKHGAKLVLYVEPDGSLVGLDDQALAAQNVGHRVRVIGQRDQSGIKLQKVEAADAPSTNPPNGADHHH
jgi:hypothetical protein